MGRTIKLSFFFLITLGALGACAKNTISDRDTRREQLRVAAENKRKELEPVIGRYAGSLLLSENRPQSVSLRLEIRDIPTAVEGQVDPVMTPTLAGDMKLTFGKAGAITEYLPFALEKSDFDPKTSRVFLVFSSTQYKDLTLSLIREDQTLRGTWTLQKVGSGNLSLERREDSPGLSDQLRGIFQGKLTNTNPLSNLPERIQIGFETSQDTSEPSGLKTTGSMRFYTGDFDSQEYWERRFGNVHYLYFFRQLNAKTTEDGLTLKVKIEAGKLMGSIVQDGVGEMATLEVTKQ